jgi:hypothetical protein
VTDDIQQRIADVLRGHPYAKSYYWSDGCRCGWYKETDGNDHQGHLAAVLVSELGLTQEWSHELSRRGFSSRQQTLDHARHRENYYNLDAPLKMVSRWVSEWRRDG